MRARSHCGVGSGARLKALNDINIGGGLSPPLPPSSTDYTSDSRLSNEGEH